MSKQLVAKLLTSMMLVLWVTACTHTVQGMKQDIREDTSSDTQHTKTVKQTTVVKYQDVPSSPPPLETPAQ